MFDKQKTIQKTTYLISSIQELNLNSVKTSLVDTNGNPNPNLNSNITFLTFIKGEKQRSTLSMMPPDLRHWIKLIFTIGTGRISNKGHPY